LANSCLVIDEADFYDNFTQANILVLLKILKNWNIPILLMSASLPDSILPIYQKLGYNVKEIIENKTDNKRNRVNIKKIQKYSKISDTEKILNKCIKKGNGIIFANTVNKAISFYNWFRNRNIKPILYHSRFSEPDKIKIEKKLIDALGEDAWKNNCAKGIVIVTQIGEMSVNISADIIVSDLCPIDRLIQRIGRLCRFDKSKLGDLYILIPFKDGNEYPAPYGYYNMSAKKWISNDKYSKTLTSLHPKIYNNDDLLNILNKIYSNYTILQKSKDNANMLIKYFKTNWIINPMQSTDDDDVDVNYWKSRNITPQDAVYITEPKNDRFINYSEFFSWKLNNQVMTYDYLIEKGLKNNQIKTKDIYINNILNTIYITNIYDNDKGLILDYDEFN
jgi:CRISPR-associated endonuclease/helicase Cas3